MQRIKVIHVLDHFDVGGLQNGVVNLINGLDTDLFEHGICGITRIGRSQARIGRSDVRYFDIAKGAGHDIWMPLRLARIFWKERPHIVHTRNWGSMDGIFAAKLARVPALVHSEHGRDQSNMVSESRRRILARRIMFRMADCVFTVSDELREFFYRQTGFPREHMAMIPNGVELSRFSGNETEGAARRAALGLDAESFVVGAVGRLDPVKDYLTLLRAVAMLRQKKPRLHTLIVGDGPERAALEGFIRAEGMSSQVSLLGYRSDLPELLAAINVFVLPSLSEGMSNTILEAMAAGRTVIASRVGGNPQLIEDGVSGLLFSAGDAEGLAAHLERLSSHAGERQRLGGNALRRVETEFSLSRMVSRYTELYAGLAKSKGLALRSNDSRFVAT